MNEALPDVPEVRVVGLPQLTSGFDLVERLDLPMHLKVHGPLEPMGGDTSVRPGRENGRSGLQQAAPTRSISSPPGEPFSGRIDTDAPADPAPRGSGGGRGECRLGACGTVARPQGRPAFRCRVVAP